MPGGIAGVRRKEQLFYALVAGLVNTRAYEPECDQARTPTVLGGMDRDSFYHQCNGGFEETARAVGLVGVRLGQLCFDD
jgi:hypothetical protein